MVNKSKFLVIGMGYVGLSMAVLTARHHKTLVLDIDTRKVRQLNKRQSPINDQHINKFLSNQSLDLRATSSINQGIKFNPNYVIIALPTNFQESSQSFDTSIIEEIVYKLVKMKLKAEIIIKSTIPIGFTKKLTQITGYKNIFFAPEFLREGSALYDNLYPSRIVFGFDGDYRSSFPKIINSLALKKTKIFYTTTEEAEAVKLFSNAYLALRVAFFNELDTFAMSKNLNSKNIIKGVSADSRIGNHYNNPSFGYGGYCLPKDTKQLKTNFKGISENLITGIVQSNITRKNAIVKTIQSLGPGVIGVFGITMKEGSDNFRESAILDVIKALNKSGRKIIIFEPQLKMNKFMGLKVYDDINIFLQHSSIIIANRDSKVLRKSSNTVFTRDIFGEN